MAKGCGCQTGLFKYFKPPYAEKFQAACEIHDDEYDWGGTEHRRKLVDRMLFWNILNIAEKSTKSPMRYFWFTVIAMLYYVSVRIFGRFYFKYT